MTAALKKESGAGLPGSPCSTSTSPSTYASKRSSIARVVKKAETKNVVHVTVRIGVWIKRLPDTHSSSSIFPERFE
jgi:hypothetical protein